MPFEPGNRPPESPFSKADGLRIAFVQAYLAERFGGPVCLAKRLEAQLTAMGHTVSLWAPGEAKDDRELASIDSARIFEIVFPRLWYRSKGLARALSDAAGSLDVMHVQEFWPYTVYVASRVARTRDIPYVLGPSGSLQPWSLRNSPTRYLKKKIYLELLGRSILRHAACVHAHSTEEAKNLRRIGYTGPIAVIGYGVDVDEFTRLDCPEAEAFWPALKDRLVVLFMSRLSPEKGLDLLIPAWADIVSSRAFSEALLVIAGPDYRGYQKTLKGMIDRHNLHSRVLLTGLVRGIAKIALYRRADVFVLPSHSESFGVVVAEALSCETPVITTTATPWQELIDADAGRWVPTRKDALTEALREMLNASHERRKAMGRRGRDLVLRNYTWSLAARKMITVYRCVLEGKIVPMYPEPAEIGGVH